MKPIYLTKSDYKETNSPLRYFIQCSVTLNLYCDKPSCFFPYWMGVNLAIDLNTLSMVFEIWNLIYKKCLNDFSSHKLICFYFNPY